MLPFSVGTAPDTVLSIKNRARRGTISIADDPKRVNAAARLLRVENVRLEAPVHAEAHVDIGLSSLAA